MNRQERAKSIIRIQHQPENIRNVCVLAHVDHGKTTLTDSLVASNGLISEKLAGKVRFLDRREDEQLRGITMEAHAVSIVYKDTYLINLIDSPGHVDFSADVSSAVRLCDGGFVVVDVVEGVCVQTHAVIRVAWEEGLKMCLVLNKIDRLCLELKLTIEEAFEHIHRVLESVNAIISEFIRGETDSEEHIDEMEKDFLFSPEKGNVVFSSGTDAWSFSLLDFVPLVAKLTEGDETEILKGLWGLDKFWDAKNKVVVSSSSQPPMFANFILRNIWSVYEAIFEEKPKRLANILSVLNISVTLGKDKKSSIRTVMNTWLPCSKALLEMVLRVVPNPAAAKRARKLLSKDSSEAFAAIQKCDSNGPLIAFVSKMLAIKEGDDCQFIAMGRVFSGTIKAGMKMKVIGPKNTIDEVEGVQPLLIMGGDFTQLDEIPAGNVFAISGLGNIVLKTATLCSVDLDCPSLLKMPAQSAPLLKVSIEPLDPRDWSKLSKGLKLLNRADPVIEILISPSGEHLICAIGELHLERCLKDLKELFAQVDFKVSAPLASFRETIVHMKESNTGVLFQDDESLVTIKGLNHLAVRSTPIPDEIAQKIEEGLTIPNEIQQIPVLATNSHGNVLLSKVQNLPLDVVDGLISGFQLAVKAGPLCEEPMRGVGFVIENSLDQEQHQQPSQQQEELEGGAVVSLCGDAFKKAFKLHTKELFDSNAATTTTSINKRDSHLGARLVEAILKCSFHCLAEGDQLGNLFSVISRRRGKIISEGVIDGTSLFFVETFIPVIEAYGIADELRKKTSGSASSPQLIFSHWEVLDIDPFMSRSADELEQGGEAVQADRDNNLALKLIIQVRKRKGLFTGEKVVAVAEKQRTLNRKV